MALEIIKIVNTTIYIEFLIFTVIEVSSIVALKLIKNECLLIVINFKLLNFQRTLRGEVKHNLKFLKAAARSW